MLLHKSGGEHPAAHRPERQGPPEAVYLQRMLAWSGVIIGAFIGIELLIKDHSALGVAVLAITVVGMVVLRSRAQVRSQRRPARDVDERS